MKVVPRVSNWVLILGGGAGQVPFIKAVKILGYQACVIDRNLKAPGRLIADEYWGLSTYDYEAIKKKITEHASQLINIVAIIARVSGPALETAAKLSDLLKVSGLNFELVRMCNSKSGTRDFCKENHIPVPSGTVYGKDDVPSDFDIKLGSCVVRPDYTLIGKQSISLCTSQPQLDNAIKSAALASANSKADVAFYKEGRDITTLFAIDGGKSHFLVAWEEINHFNTDGFSPGVLQPNALEAPVNIDKSLTMKVEEFANIIAKKYFKVVHLVAISWRLQSDNSLFLIEIHLDLTGDRILDELLPGAFGCDVIKPITKWLIEKTPESLDCLVGFFKEKGMRKAIEINRSYNIEND